MSTFKLLLVIVLFLGIQIFAQEESDSLSTNKKRECISDKEDWFDFDWEKDGFGLRGSPTISLIYGQSKIRHKNFTQDFTDPKLIELKLGYTTLRPSKYSEDILRYKYSNVFLSNYFTKSNSDNSISKNIRTEMWRFGLAWTTGYGYDLGELSIIPYNSASISWSRVKFKDVLLDSIDANIAERYNESFRFGTGAEAGVKIQIIPLISLEAGYERSIIFERHLFWKWAGSGIIEVASQGALDHFIKKIGKSTPAALPIVSFVLKSALSYGIYELRQEKMNWPFNGAAPLSYDQWKVGVTFSF
jgi:opacity protein-like surface antigen